MDTIAKIFFNTAEKYPSKIAIQCDGREITFRELKNLVSKYANYLKSSGVKKGDIIAIPMNNSIESVSLILAVSVLGVGIAPFNQTLSKEAVFNLLKYSKAKHLIARCAFFENYSQEELFLIKGFKLCLDKKINNADSFEDVLSQNPNITISDDITGQETFILTLTSGSTGDPKPIELTLDNKLKRIKAHIELYNIKNDDIVLTSTPLYHSLAQRLVLLPLLIGAKCVILPRFTPALWVECVKEQKVSFTIAVSAQLNSILKYIDSNSYDFSSLRSLVSSSALLEGKVRNKLISKLQCEFHEMYGTSETSTVTSINFKESLNKINSVGKPLNGVEIKIVDDSNKTLLPFEEGQILVKTPLLFKGYYAMEEKTNQALIDGYFQTGDIGKIDNDGYLYFVARKKEIIITGGINVYPQDVENVISKLEGVKECAVFPYPDEELGEVVALALVLDKNATVEISKIRKYCAKNLADFQQPRKIFFFEEIPKNALGKIQRNKLPSLAEKESKPSYER